MIFALLASAYCVRQRSPSRALALAVLATAFEPHLALASLISTARVANRKTWVVLAFLAGASACWFLVDPILITSYVNSLRAHATAEIGWFGGQYGTSALFYALGMSVRHAIKLSLVIYLLSIAGGVVIALRFHKVTGDRAFLVLMPLPFVILGSQFLHTTDLCVGALPAILVAYRFAKHRLFFSVIFASCLVPWFEILRAFSYFRVERSLPIHFSTADIPTTSPASEIWTRYISAVVRATPIDFRATLIEHALALLPLVVLCGSCVWIARPGLRGRYFAKASGVTRSVGSLS